MTIAEEKKFKVRENGENIVYSGKGNLMNLKIEEGDNVDLNCDETRILIKNIKKIDSDIFEGVIRGFDPIINECYGLKINDLVTFNEKHIMICDKK